MWRKQSIWKEIGEINLRHPLEKVMDNVISMDAKNVLLQIDVVNYILRSWLECCHELLSCNQILSVRINQ